VPGFGEGISSDSDDDSVEDRYSGWAVRRLEYGRASAESLGWFDETSGELDRVSAGFELPDSRGLLATGGSAAGSGWDRAYFGAACPRSGGCLP
jgi:hypothetical protein